MQFTNQKKCTTTQNKHQKIQPGLVTFYDIRPGNAASLFSKEKISKGGDKYKEKVKKRTSGEANDINKQTIAWITAMNNVTPHINRCQHYTRFMKV